MVQYGRPGADTSIGAYVDEADGTTTIYTSIDETSASETDYIKSVAAPSTAPYVTALTTLVDPASSANHTVRYRYRKDSAGGSQIDLVVQLREGYVNEGTPGTLIATDTNADIGETITAGSFTLSGAEADAITDYTDLALRFTFNQV